MSSSRVCFFVFFNGVLCCSIMCLSSVLWCPLRFPHKTMLGSFSTQLFEGVLMSYCVCLFIVMSNILPYRVFLCLFVESVLIIFLVFVIWCFCVCLGIVMSNILKINVRVGIYPNICLYVLSPVLWCPLRFTQKTDVRFVFTSCCL
jgi:hypothetical protein